MRKPLHLGIAKAEKPIVEQPSLLRSRRPPHRAHLVSVLTAVLVLAMAACGILGLARVRAEDATLRTRSEARALLEAVTSNLGEVQGEILALSSGAPAAQQVTLLSLERKVDTNFDAYRRLTAQSGALSPADRAVVDDMVALQALPGPSTGSSTGHAEQAEAGRIAMGTLRDIGVAQAEDQQWWSARIATERRDATDAIWWLVGSGALALVVLIGGTSLVARAGARREATVAERERELSAAVETNEFEARLQRALELASSERRVYKVVERALAEAVPGVGAELLLADSSRAHFHQLVTSGDLGHRGCSVESPVDCPAAQRGAVLKFASSTALDACPYLQAQEEPCSAVCVPVSVSGTTVGVVHASGADGELPEHNRARALELVARRTSDRIGMLRAFARSEIQANTDSLTGLPNRRALEDQVNRLDLARTEYAVAFGDLDRFKLLNDVHGHSAGDQALRLFAKTVRGALRPDDLVGRFGGEEFVVVLPDCGEAAALAVLERVRAELAAAVVETGGPAFTVSFGLAAHRSGVSFESLVHVADSALLQAKSAGRDRVVVADAATPVATLA